MAAETCSNRFIRKPNSILWIATVTVILYAVWSVLLSILTASGLLFSKWSFECGDSEDVEASLKFKAVLVYLWSGLSLTICILLLVDFWRRNGVYVRTLAGATSVLFLSMILSFWFWENDKQVIKEFEERYLALLPLNDTRGNAQNRSTDTIYINSENSTSVAGVLNSTDTICHALDYVYLWQAEFKCCGLQSYKDWVSLIPDSCLCEEENNRTGRCDPVGDIFVYKKPCLPGVVSLKKKPSSVFFIVMTLWIGFTGVPVIAFMFCVLDTLLRLGYWVIHKICFYVWKHDIVGGVEMVPVVIIRKSNNNQAEEDAAEENGSDDGVVLDMEDGANVEGERQEEGLVGNTLRMIPLSELRRLQEGLDPSPVHRQVQCTCNVHAVLIEEGSPLLPIRTAQVDANETISMPTERELPCIVCYEM